MAKKAKHAPTAIMLPFPGLYLSNSRAMLAAQKLREDWKFNELMEIIPDSYLHSACDLYVLDMYSYSEKSIAASRIMMLMENTSSSSKRSGGLDSARPFLECPTMAIGRRI